MGSISTVYTEADVATRLDAVAAPVTAKSARPGATTASEYVTVSVMGNVLVYCVDSHVSQISPRPDFRYRFNSKATWFGI